MRQLALSVTLLCIAAGCNRTIEVPELEDAEFKAFVTDLRGTVEYVEGVTAADGKRYSGYAVGNLLLRMNGRFDDPGLKEFQDRRVTLTYQEPDEQCTYQRERGAGVHIVDVYSIERTGIIRPSDMQFFGVGKPSDDSRDPGN